MIIKQGKNIIGKESNLYSKQIQFLLMFIWKFLFKLKIQLTQKEKKELIKEFKNSILCPSYLQEWNNIRELKKLKNKKDKLMNIKERIKYLSNITLFQILLNYIKEMRNLLKKGNNKNKQLNQMNLNFSIQRQMQI